MVDGELDHQPGPLLGLPGRRRAATSASSPASPCKRFPPRPLTLVFLSWPWSRRPSASSLAGLGAGSHPTSCGPTACSRPHHRVAAPALQVGVVVAGSPRAGSHVQVVVLWSRRSARPPSSRYSETVPFSPCHVRRGRLRLVQPGGVPPAHPESRRACSPASPVWPSRATLDRPLDDAGVAALDSRHRQPRQSSRVQGAAGFDAYGGRHQPGSGGRHRFRAPHRPRIGAVQRPLHARHACRPSWPPASSGSQLVPLLPRPTSTARPTRTTSTRPCQTGPTAYYGVQSAPA